MTTAAFEELDYGITPLGEPPHGVLQRDDRLPAAQV